MYYAIKVVFLYEKNKYKKLNVCIYYTTFKHWNIENMNKYKYFNLFIYYICH